MNLVVILQRLGIIASSLTPRKLADIIARAIGLGFYFFASKRRLYIRKNLDYILKDETRDCRRKIARQTFTNFAMTMVDFFRLSYISKENFEVSCHGIKHIKKALLLNQGCILISLHIGNWDYGGAYLASQGIPMLALVQETDPVMFLLYTKHRERMGMKTYPVSKAPYAFIETLKRNKVLAILADRNVYGPGKKVEFLSGFRHIPEGLLDIILRYRIPVVISYIVLQKQGTRYRIFICPLSYDKQDIKTFEEKLIQRFERIIRQYPDQWFVFHPEWIEE